MLMISPGTCLRSRHTVNRPGLNIEQMVAQLHIEYRIWFHSSTGDGSHSKHRSRKSLLPSASECFSKILVSAFSISAAEVD